MSEEKNEYRKLSAIMFTDLVGYSAMVQKNESMALALLEEHRQILRPIFPKHNGEEIETAGDAFFVEFKSALEAVQCAVEIQKFLHDRNSKVEPEKQITLRIGLHIGDVVHMGKHVHGDGVNIAARLEPLSQPGGICLSEDVYRQIHNKFELPLKSLGTKNLKNIKSPINIYSVILPWETRRKGRGKITFKKTITKNLIYAGLLFVALFILLTWMNTRNSSEQDHNNRIAVLPLLNISNNSQDDYFADGMTEELISQLAKISGLNVIARTSVMKYKNTQTDIKEIGNKLDVSTILEGSVRTASDKARISVQLIDVKTQEHLWTEEFDRELKDIISIQSDIAIKIANELKVKLLKSEQQLIQKVGTDNAEAYRLYLLGKHLLNERTGEDINKSLKYFRSAIELDPTYALPYVGIADCYTLMGGAGYGSLPLEKVVKYANNAINSALQLDNTLAEAYNSLAYLEFRLEWDWKKAESNFKKAIELKPGYSAAYERYALCLALLGRYAEALPLMMRASELDPLSASVATGIGRIYHFSHQFDKAIDQFKKTLVLKPDYVEAVFGLGLSYSQKNNFKMAISEVNKAIGLSNGRLIIIAALGSIYAKAGDIERANKVYNRLILLSQEQPVSPYYFAVIDASLGNTENALDSLYKSYEEHFGILVYSKATPFYDNLRSQVRFRKLLQKIGLD